MRRRVRATRVQIVDTPESPEAEVNAGFTVRRQGNRPDTSEVIVNLIASTTTKKGLLVRAQLDTTEYPAGRKVSEQEIAELDLRRDSFHGEWNYTLFPRKKIASDEVIS